MAGKGFDLSIDRLGSSAFQEAMGSTMAIPPEEVCQADFSLPAVAIGPQVNLLNLESPPQSFHQDVVVSPLSS
jgi:hypothetical protein